MQAIALIQELVHLLTRVNAVLDHVQWITRISLQLTRGNQFSRVREKVFNCARILCVNCFIFFRFPMMLCLLAGVAILFLLFAHLTQFSLHCRGKQESWRIIAIFYVNF